MVEDLALYFNTNFVSEVGRDVCEYAGGEEFMIKEDFDEILLKHKLREMEALKDSNKYLFVDTDALTTKFYSNYLIKNDYQLPDEIDKLNHYDLIFFIEPVNDFTQDGTRNEEIKENRKFYSEQLKSYYDEKQLIILSDDYYNNFETIVNMLQS